MTYFKTGNKVLMIINFFELNPNSTALEASQALRIDRFKVRSVLNYYLKCFDTQRVLGKPCYKRYTLKPGYKDFLIDKGLINDLGGK
jgi:hypothetical protein